MARTEDEKRRIAEEFRQRFTGRPGEKNTQRALGRQEFDEVPQRAPRNKGIRRPHSPRWDLSVRVSSTAQADIAARLREDKKIVAGFNRVIQQIEDHPGQLTVLDANIFLHGVSSESPRPYCGTIIDMVEDGELSPCVSTGVVAEIADVGRLMRENERLTPTDYERLMALMKIAINVDSLPLLPLMDRRPVLPDDQSDVKYLVVAAKARRFSRGEPVPLITMDAHLLTAPENVMGEVEVMNPRAFLDWIKNR